MPRERATLRVGLVGPGRSRNGLGPYLARHLEAAGARVVAVAGRDPGRTAAAAAALEGALGHPLAVCTGVDALVARGGLDALVIASPVAAHRAALASALAAGLPTLCEKPLAEPAAWAEASTLLDGFESRGLLLVENCQWPYVLPAVRDLVGGARLAGVREFAMRLSPMAAGWRLIEESLSHALSLVQELRSVGPQGRLEGIAFAGCGERDVAQTVTFTLAGAGEPLACRLELVRHEPQPRPAWLAFDGLRVDRAVELPAYEWWLEAGGRRQCAGDPQRQLVYSFVRQIQEPEVDRARTIAAIRERARLFHAVWAAWRAAGGQGG